jgi:hypothetical protein
MPPPRPVIDASTGVHWCSRLLRQTQRCCGSVLFVYSPCVGRLLQEDGDDSRQNGEPVDVGFAQISDMGWLLLPGCARTAPRLRGAPLQSSQAACISARPTPQRRWGASTNNPSTYPTGPPGAPCRSGWTDASRNPMTVPSVSTARKTGRDSSSASSSVISLRCFSSGQSGHSWVLSNKRSPT